MDEKMTKAEYFEVIRDIVEASDAANADDLIEFINVQIAQIEKKAAQARARADAKKIAGDELRAQVEAILTGDFQSAEDILAQMDDDDLTVGKIRARLKQLVDNGIAVKATKKCSDDKRHICYALAALVNN